MASLYWAIRENLRMSNMLGNAVYLLQRLRYIWGSEFSRKVKRASEIAEPGEGVALCVRIRDEALNLREFIEYYLAAGVRHIFFYEALSTDDFRDKLRPFVDAGVVTLIENWPHVPVSPAAEHDCVLRCIGSYEWVGFVDVDEFVVIGDNSSIGEFLAGVPASAPALAMHWRYYGSNGHLTRPNLPVIAAYCRRNVAPNRHVKVFVRPGQAVHCRNSHSWYYGGLLSTAVNEKGKRVFGSTSTPITAEFAWINHYYHKSEEEFAAKGARVSILDAVGIRFNSRTPERGQDYEKAANAVEDHVAILYHRARCRQVDCSICAAVANLS